MYVYCTESLLETCFCACFPKNILILRVDKGGLISESFFTLGPICRKKMPNQYSEHLFFRWIVLIIVILVIGAKLKKYIYEIKSPLHNGK